MNIKELCIRFFNRVFKPYPHELIEEYCRRSEQRIEDFSRQLDREIPISSSKKKKHKGHKKMRRFARSSLNRKL